MFININNGDKVKVIRLCGRDVRWIKRIIEEDKSIVKIYIFGNLKYILW